MKRVLLCCQFVGILAFSAFYAQSMVAQEQKAPADGLLGLSTSAR
jgi:hypothetical protein